MTNTGDGFVRKEPAARRVAAEAEGPLPQAHERADIETEKDPSLRFHSLRKSRGCANRNGHNAE